MVLSITFREAPKFRITPLLPVLQWIMNSILTQHKCTLQITLILNDRSSFIHSTEQTFDLSLVHRTLLYIGNHAQELSKSGHGQCNLQKTVENHCQYFRSTVSGCTTYMYDMSLRI